MPNMLRTPTADEAATLERSRGLMQRGIASERDPMSRMMPTMGKAARDDMRMAKRMRESVPYAAREADSAKDVYAKGGMTKKFAKGGSVSSASKRADGCAQRGKTKGKFV